MGKLICRYLAILLFGAQSLFSDVANVKDIQIAYIYNFAKFITWPSEIDQNETLHICSYADVDLDGKLARLDNKPLGKKKIAVVRIKHQEEIQKCQILLLPSMQKRKLEALIEKAKAYHVVTISNTKGYALQGVMINFYVEKRKVRFEINHQNAKQADIKISSKLLRVAKVVKSD